LFFKKNCFSYNICIQFKIQQTTRFQKVFDPFCVLKGAGYEDKLGRITRWVRLPHHSASTCHGPKLARALRASGHRSAGWLWDPYTPYDVCPFEARPSEWVVGVGARV